jgi:hypothetical protein
MVGKHADRIGGPGAAHENAKAPEKSRPRGHAPAEGKNRSHSRISGGGGEPDRHHAHDAQAKKSGGQPRPSNPGDVAPAGTPGAGEHVCPVCRGTGRMGGQFCRSCNGTGKVIAGIGGA